LIRYTWLYRSNNPYERQCAYCRSQDAHIFLLRNTRIFRICLIQTIHT